VIFQVTSCFKSAGTTFYDCPAFSDPVYDDWFPYLRSQVIKYKNAAGLENTISIHQMEKSPDYKYYDGGGSCLPNVRVESSQTNSSSIPFLLEYRKGVVYSSVNIVLKTVSFDADNIKDTGLMHLPGTTRRFNKTQFLSVYNLNGKNYSNVQIITRDTGVDKATDIYKIVIAKKIGILAFEEYPSLTQWVKQ
jgi:hypothetical protein